MPKHSGCNGHEDLVVVQSDKVPDGFSIPKPPAVNTPSPDVIRLTWRRFG